MIFKIVTLFPDFFSSVFQSGLLGKAIKNGIVSVEVVDLRNYSEDRYHRCDDYPYGGGAGMVLKPEPVFKAISANKTKGAKVIYASPGGVPFNQELAHSFKKENELIILCGNYEGIDQRAIDSLVDVEVSVGDYILSGGEYAACIFVDAISRLFPGFMSNEESILHESFETGLLEYPQYTRPAEYNGLHVPNVLISGNHAAIDTWRHEESIKKTKRVRPDLYKKYLKSITSEES